MNADPQPRLPPVIDYPHGIVCVDTLQERAGLACCYLVRRGEDLAFVEAGTAPGVPRLLALLDARGLARERVRYVIPTHVHLDHAGGAGALLRELPAAKLVAHPRGARHLIDPSKLIVGAQAVYGAAAVARMYGEIVPVPEDRVIVADDGARLPFGDAELQFVDAPGHARHHFCVWDVVSRGFFCGDSFGLSYREFDGPGGPFLFPTTTPVQFEPDAWMQTLDRLLSFAPQRMYLTHYGCVDNVEHLARMLRAGIERYRTIAEALAKQPQRHAKLVAALMADALRELAMLDAPVSEARARKLLAFDMELNAQGLEVWLDRAA
ncbi:MBL fold metallo-hydrolase [Sinimarinibacterium thermocellulolyticum]|uniref:MBL fold metallo-hydrolase n=1 Tax=Sinimarinibacterium thermocellulolyticum TaxID=3170016 RepID=A0ABV2A9Z0_9GAMM